MIIPPDMRRRHQYWTGAAFSTITPRIARGYLLLEHGPRPSVVQARWYYDHQPVYGIFFLSIVHLGSLQRPHLAPVNIAAAV